MASPSPPFRVLSHGLPAHPSGVRLPTREGAPKTPAHGRPQERSRVAPRRGAVGGCYGEVWIDSDKREIEMKEQEWGGEERQRRRTHSGMGVGGGGGCGVRARDQEQLPGRARRRRTSEAAASASCAAAAGAAAAAEVNCNLTSSCLLSPSEVGV